MDDGPVAGDDADEADEADVVVVAHRRGATDGDVSVLTRAAWSHRGRDERVEVVHVHLGRERLAATVREMYGREVVDVEVRGTERVDDPVLHRTAVLIAQEVAEGGVGSELLVEALTTQLSVRILREHAAVRRAPGGRGCLSARQEDLVRDYVQTHLHTRLTLDELAGCVRLSRSHFARRFRGSTGTTPHEFVLTRRLDRARRLLRRTDTPLPEIAQQCGFADQSHMNRLFRRRLGTTPGAVRRRH